MPLDPKLETYLGQAARRIHRLSVRHQAAAGAVVGAFVGLMLQLCGYAWTGSPSFWPLAAVPVFALAFAGREFLKSPTLLQAARHVDRKFGTLDHLTSALQLAESVAENPDPKARSVVLLQQTAALKAAAEFDPSVITEPGLPSGIRWVGPQVFLMILIAVFPLADSNAAVVQPVDGLQTARAQITETVRTLRQQAIESGREDLNELADRFDQQLQALSRPDTDLVKVLQTLSSMQQMMEELGTDPESAAKEDILKKAGSALAQAKPLAAAGNALADGDFSLAADELESADLSELNSEESRAAADLLQETAGEASQQELSELAEQINDLAESLRAGDKEQTAEAARQLAETARQRMQAAESERQFDDQIDSLADMKAALAAQNSQGGGQMANRSTEQTERSSDSSSKQAGGQTAGNTSEDNQRLRNTKEIAELRGRLSAEGEREFESDDRPAEPAEQQRTARETHDSYRKQAESVIEGESVPPTYRRTIREYFERIRPSAAPPPSDAPE